jgi:hypothetical protein
MMGCHLLEGILVLRETIHEYPSKKMNGGILKIDFEEEYDKVKLTLLQQVFFERL